MRRYLLFGILFLLCTATVSEAQTYLGDFLPNSTVYWKFALTDSTGASVNPSTAFEAADMACYKNGSDVERASTSGYTLTSTFDGRTGLVHVSIDLADNTTADFWAVGSEYQCIIASDETIGGVTTLAVIAHFSIGRGKDKQGADARLALKAGTVSYVALVYLEDTRTGGPLTLLTYADLDGSPGTAYYARSDQGNAAGTSMTLVTATRGTYTSLGFVEKDATNMPGWYELGVPAACLATGSAYCTIHLQGAANMKPSKLFIELTSNTVADTITLLGTPTTATVSDDIAAVQATSDSIQGTTYRKNVASQVYAVYMTNSSGTAGTGLTLDVEVSQDGGAFGNITGSVAEIGQGWYYISFSQADTNCDLCVYISKAASALTRAFYFTTAP